jgi:linoleoyl-CoA desaturase
MSATNATRRRLPPLTFRGTHAAFRRAVIDALERTAPFSGGSPSGHRKAAALIGWVAALFALVVSGRLHGAALVFGVALLQVSCLVSAMGIGHDGSHASFARRPWLNVVAAGVYDFVGVNGYVWYFDHVTAHHTTPNVSRYDANLYGWGPIRLDPHAPWKPWHRFQHLYAPFIYMFASLYKVYAGDIIALRRTRAEAYLPPRAAPKDIVRLVVFKISSIAFTLAIPIAANGRVGLVVAGYFLGHASAGLLMGAIFQPTHTNEWVTWPRPDADASFATSFDQHVLATAVDFAVDSAWITWLSGGLNIHAVHHLFPRLDHMRLREAARAVRSIAPEHGLTYRTFPTWRSAIASHFRTLRALGRSEVVSIVPRFTAVAAAG